MQPKEIGQPDPRAAFFNTINEKLDSQIGEEVFTKLFEAALKGCKVVDWKREKEDHTFRLILDSAYSAEITAGKIFHLEKVILCQLVPDRHEIVLPKVLEYKESGKSIDPANKNLNAIWASENWRFVVYTGVGYSIKWNKEARTITTLNINDAPFGVNSKRVRKLDDVLEEWNSSQRKALPSTEQ